MFFLQPSYHPCASSHHQKRTPVTYINSHKAHVTLEGLLLGNQDSNRQEMKEKGPPEKCSKTLPSSDSPTERRARLHVLPLKSSCVSLYLDVHLSPFSIRVTTPSCTVVALEIVLGLHTTLRGLVSFQRYFYSVSSLCAQSRAGQTEDI